MSTAVQTDTGASAAALDGSALADALRAGIHRVFAQTDHLNKINVFPVPDGDTGTNLSMTLSAVLAALDRGPTAHAGELLTRAADAALDGARGNSGAILAQFLLGLADGTSPHATLTTEGLVRAATTGAAYAREAMNEPKEGTLITVLRAFADALEAAHRRDPEAQIRATLHEVLPHVRAALAATATQLEAIRAAHVVDAGAQGFVAWLEGLLHYLDTGHVDQRSFAVAHDPGAEPMADSPFIETRPGLQALEPRWCTECLVRAATENAELDLRQLRERLSQHGTSLVVGGSKYKARIHLHTDDPERVFTLAAGFGIISGQKADDMHRQTRAAHHTATQRVAIVTDSAADIPEELIEHLGIHIVPLRIHFGAHSYLDKVTMIPAEFYAELARNPEHPKTSQPPAGDFRRIYEFLASHYERVVSISVTAKASGTHSAAMSAAHRLGNSADGRPVVTVVDSLSVSCGQGLVTIAAAECARAGGSLDDVVAAAESARARTCGFALLTNLDYAVRGGRVPGVARSVADALRLSVVLATREDGQVKPGGALLGRQGMESAFSRFAIRRFIRLSHASGAPPRTVSRQPTYRIMIGYGTSRDRAELLAEAIRAQLGAEAITHAYILEIGTALGVHGGPDALILGVQRNSS